jgi:hypothetical protein
MSLDSDFGSSRPTECICRGAYRRRTFFKDESKKEVGSVEVYCPMCHPNLAAPFEPQAGQVEISQEEFNDLSLRWKRFVPKP